MKSKLSALIGFLLISSIAVAQVPIQILPGTNATPASQMASDMNVVSNLIRLGEIPRALAVLERMKSTYGDNPSVKALYKQAYKEGKLYVDLENMIRADLQADPKNPVLMAELGEARFLQNDETAADSLWLGAIQNGKSDGNVYRLVAEDMMRYGLYDMAIETYLKARQNFNKPSLFSEELANLYETQHDYPKAVSENLIEVLDEPGQLAYVSNRIRGYMEDTDAPEQIIGVVKSKIKEFPGRYELYEILGDLYIKQNQMDKALECYKTISIKQSDDGQALIRFAMRSYDSKAYMAASNAVDDYFRLSKKLASKDLALLIKAKSQLALGQVDPALESFKRLANEAVDFRIKDEAGLSCGLIYAQYKNDCDSALQAWAGMQKNVRDPGLQGRARLELAMCYLKKDDMASAENYIKQVLAGKAADSTMEKATYFLGEIAFYKGNLKDADAAFKQLISNYPQGDHANDALMRLEVMNLAGDDSGSQKILTDYAQAMKGLDLNRPIETAKILSNGAFDNSPMAEQALFYAATAFAAGNSNSEAIGAFKSYIEKYPDGLYIDRAYLGLGDLYLLDPATHSDAKAAYDKILEAFPDGPVTEVARQRLLKLTAPGKIG